MQYLAPLIQTVLWVGLIGAIVWRFHRPIHGILLALQRRIESGSNLEAGPFKLGGQLRPQDPEKQKQKLELEHGETNEPESPPSKAPEGTEASLAVQRLLSAVAKSQMLSLQAEDLALRAIQAEYGAALQRQVTGGADSGFDGVFVMGSRTYVVEVKYVHAGRLNRFIPRMRGSLERLVSSVAAYKWPDPHLILVVVFEAEQDVSRADIPLLETVKGLAIPVTIRPFSIRELRHRFGIDTNEA